MQQTFPTETKATQGKRTQPLRCWQELASYELEQQPTAGYGNEELTL